MKKKNKTDFKIPYEKLTDSGKTMPPKGGRRLGAGRKPSFRRHLKQDGQQLLVNIGQDNVRKWLLLKETLGYQNDIDFTAFLLNLAEKQEPSVVSFTVESKPDENKDNDNNEGASISGGNVDGSCSNHISTTTVESKETSETKSGHAKDTKTADEGEGDDDNESPSEDEKDIDWTPAGCRDRRCTRLSTRVATLKSRQRIRQTRTVSRVFVSQTSKRKRSSPTSDARKVPPLCLSVSSTVSVMDLDAKHSVYKVDKLRQCVDCNHKHLQSECPLTKPLFIVDDALSSAFTSEVDTRQRPYAELTLPKVLKLICIDKSHGLSVFAGAKLSQYTQFGPLVGQRIEEADIHEEMDMKNIWEIFGSGHKLYLETFDENVCNWLRYVRPASSKGERNLSAVSREDKLYFVTVKDVDAGTELLYWSEDPLMTWTKKKMEKSSCGGCNQRFLHPLYYRMHCMIFHDPNYSLTIRKYHCKICGIAVLGKENIMRHASEMHEGKGAYQCQYCKKFFLRLNYLDMHRTYGCKLNPRRSRPLCDLCGKKFCQPQKLKVHIRRMHSDISEVLKEFQCKMCFKLLGSRAALQRHLKEVHNKDQNIAATCDRCGKTFQNKSNLKIHMLTHSGVKPFRCIESGCMAAFTTKQCLQFHYKKVHSYTMDSMPNIERCIAYTFESYSGGSLTNDCMSDPETSQFDDCCKSVASVISTSNSDNESSSASMVDLSLLKAKTPDPTVVGDLLACSTGTLEKLDSVNGSSTDSHWVPTAAVVEVPDRGCSPLPNEPKPLLLQLSSSSQEVEQSAVVEDGATVTVLSDPSKEPLLEVDCLTESNVKTSSKDQLSGGTVSEAVVHLPEKEISLVKLEKSEEECRAPIPLIRDFDDDGDTEQMDSSDVDLDSDIGDNSTTDHSLDLDHQEDNDSSDPMVDSPSEEVHSVCHEQEQDNIDRMQHSATRTMSIYGAHLSRLASKDKEFVNDIGGCDFALSRHYAGNMIVHSEYGLPGRGHDGDMNGNMLHQHHHPHPHAQQPENHHHHHQQHHHHHDMNHLVGGGDEAEDLTGELSRYGEGPSPHVKTEEEDLNEHHLVKPSRLDSDDADELLVTADDDDEEEEVVRQHRDDVTAALILAHQDHQQQQQQMLHDFGRLPPHHPSSRDISRLPMHSLDLSIPRTTAHLLEHLARTTPHLLDHMGGGRGGTGPVATSPDDQTVEHLSRPSSHSNVHLGQLAAAAGAPFHSMDVLPRPLPHRLDHMGHLQSSTQPHDMDSTQLEALAQTHPYVDHHLSRLPSSHAMDGYPRSHAGGTGGTGSGGMETLIRAGIEALARPAPRTGPHRLDPTSIGRSFSAYSMDHSVVNSSAGGVPGSAVQTSATSYLLTSSEHLASRPSSAYGLEHRATPHSLDLTTNRGGLGGSPSHDGVNRGGMPSPYEDCSPPPPATSSSSSSSSFQGSVLPPVSSTSSQLPQSPIASSIHSTYPTYLEYY